MKRKRILTVLFIVGLFIGSFHLYNYSTSSHTPCYSSISDYIDDNGKEYFIDMYHPESYFSSQEKKKISEINHYTIYHQLNPKEYYSIPFQLDNDLNLTVIVNRNSEIMTFLNFK